MQVWDSMYLNSPYEEINPLQLQCILENFYRHVLLLKWDNTITCSQKKISSFELDEESEFV